MTVKKIASPYKMFFNLSGTALENGKVYIGEPNLDPESNAKTVYTDSGLTTAAAQPVRTINGYISESGSPGSLFISGDFSITVRDKNDNLIYTKLTNEDESSEETSYSVTGTTGGATIKTFALSDNSGALVEVFGSGLKSSVIAQSRVKFSLFRTTGTTTITSVQSEEIQDGDDLGVWFDMVQSGNDAILKAYTDSGTWAASGTIKIISSGSVTLS